MAGQVITKIAANSGTHLISTSFYGTCATAAGTAAKAVIINDTNITDAITLVNGMTLAVKFVASNSVANPTITVYNNSGTATAPTQGSTTLIAAKSIYQVNTNLNAAGTAASTSAATSWKAGATVIFIYDGQGWVEASSTYNQDNNSTYTALSLGFGYGTCSTAAGTADKVGTLSSGALGANGSIVVMKFTNGNTATSDVTLNVNSKGKKDIYWKGAALTDASLIEAGATVTFMYDGTRYQIIGIYHDKPATTDLFKTVAITSASTSVPEGSCYEVSASLPTLEGYNSIGVIQMWTSGTGNTIMGTGYLTADRTTAKCKVRANTTASITASFLILYVKSEFAPAIEYV